MDIITKALKYIAPGAAYRREKQLLGIERLEKVRGYEGATAGRRGSGFSPTSQSANKEISKASKTLTTRSRELYMNTPYGKRTPRLIANNVVGTGITPTFSTSDKNILEKIKPLFNKWAEAVDFDCDYDGVCDFYGGQSLVMKNMVISGDIFILRKIVPVEENFLRFQIQFLESDFLDRLKNEDTTSSGGSIRNGIEYDRRGKRKGFWLFPQHPSEGRGEESKFIPIKDVIHVFDQDRPGQHLGVPQSASTILKQRDLDDFEDAELFGKKVSAAHAAFIVTNDPKAMEDADPEDYEDLNNAKLEVGTMKYLYPGEDIRFNSPPTSGAYEQYTRAHLRAVAAGNEVTYEQMTGDYSMVNFSSGRMGWLEFQRSVSHWQWNIMVHMFCKKLMRWFLEMVSMAPASVTGFGKLPDDLRVTWTTPKREMIDPVKEITAIKEQLKAGLISWQEVVRMQGYIPDDLFKELEEDYNRFKSAKLQSDSIPGLMPENKTTQQPGNDKSDDKK